MKVCDICRGTLANSGMVRRRILCVNEDDRQCWLTKLKYFELVERYWKGAAPERVHKSEDRRRKDREEICFKIVASDLKGLQEQVDEAAQCKELIPL